MTTTEKIQTMKQYLRMKLESEDWHGVMDAAADLRELEVLRTAEEAHLEVINEAR